MITLPRRCNGSSTLATLFWCTRWNGLARASAARLSGSGRTPSSPQALPAANALRAAATSLSAGNRA
eukprot:8211961-Lingulodinium_polyedra.AAC.1